MKGYQKVTLTPYARYVRSWVIVDDRKERKLDGDEKNICGVLISLYGTTAIRPDGR